MYTHCGNSWHADMHVKWYIGNIPPLFLALSLGEHNGRIRGKIFIIFIFNPFSQQKILLNFEKIIPFAARFTDNKS
jgi:hypothetical protein